MTKLSSEEKKDAVIENDINYFKTSFFEKHGCVPVVHIKKGSVPGELYRNVSLAKLEALSNMMLIEVHGDIYPKGIRTTNRKRETLLYRQMFFKIALEYGYTLKETGTFLKSDNFKGWDHATVLHGQRTINNFLESKDKLACGIYDKIKRDLNMQTLVTEGKITNIVEVAKAQAIYSYEFSNAHYNNQPFEVHIRKVVDLANKFIELIPDRDQSIVLAACWTYGLMSWCNKSYNDVVKLTSKETAELVFALTPLRGKNNSEKYGPAYVKRVNETKHASYIACCIRTAEVNYCIASDKQQLITLHQEIAVFQKTFFKHEYSQLFDYLDCLFNNHD